MRRPGLVISLVLFFAVLCGMARAVPSCPAVLEPGSLYVGSAREGDGEIQVELRLLDDHFFVLRHSFTRQGKAGTAQDFAGYWKQVENGALLQLINRHGLSLLFNIGGGGNLYGDLSFVSGRPLWSVTLKKVLWSARSFILMGRLEQGTHAGRASLTDSATGRVFSPVRGAVLEALPTDTPLFVDVEVMLDGNGLVVERVRSFSSRMPEHLPERVSEFQGRSLVPEKSRP